MSDIIGNIIKTNIGGRRKRKAIKGVIREFGGYKKDYAFVGISGKRYNQYINTGFIWKDTKEKRKFWAKISRQINKLDTTTSSSV